MSKRLFKGGSKTYLKLLMLAGVLALIGGGAGTFATFNAETTNAGNTFATGTLLLSDKVATGTACYSNANANNAESSSCQVVFNQSAQKPGTASSNYLTIKNEGTLDASDLLLFVPKTQAGPASCVNSTTGSFPNGPDNLSHTGDVCGSLLFSVEQDSSANGTATACLVGSEVGGGNHACDPTAGTAFSTFYGAHYQASNGLDLTSGSGLAAGASNFYKVYLYLPSTADNTFQGRTATFDLSWHIDQ